MVDEFRSPLADHANAGRVAIVTGGGTGIGRATARELARTGARVAICGRRPEPIEDARSELEAAGRDVLAMPCDVREPEQVESFLDAVDERFGTVDVLINNAGGQFAAPLEQIGLKGLRAVHRLNVDAPWHLTNRVAERWMIPEPARVRLLRRVQPSPGCAADGAFVRGPRRPREHGVDDRDRVVEVRDPRGLCRGGPDPHRRDVAVRRGGTWSTSTRGPSRWGGPAGRRRWRPRSRSSRATGEPTSREATVVVDGGADAWGIGSPPPPPE